MKKIAILFLLCVCSLVSSAQTAPSWLAGLRYSYASGLLTFEGTTGIGKLQFERTDGVSFQTTNPDGVPIESGKFYIPGGNSDPTYNKKWQINYSGPQLRITAQQLNTTEVYSYTLTPVSGASGVSLPVVVVVPPVSTSATSSTALKRAIDINLFSPVGLITATKLKTTLYIMADAIGSGGTGTGTGSKGDKGDKGDTGPIGPIGPVGPAGPASTGGGGGGSGVFYTVTTLTCAAINTALNAVSSNSRITLAPGNYDCNGTTILFGGKTNIILDGAGTANLISSTSTIIRLNGDNVNSRITGINFSNTGSGVGGNGLILINEQGSNNGLEIDHNTFTAPNYLQNGITASVYSVQANGGSGQGKLTQDVRIHDNRFVSLGRMGIELVNHTWDDNKTDVYLKNVQIYHNYFKDLGRVAESYDVNLFNGMAVSNSGYAQDIAIIGNEIVDARLLGIELAGSEKAIIANNTITAPNNTFVGISVSDNSHNATKYITISGNNVRSKTTCLSLNQVTEFAVTGNVFVQTAQTTTANTVYFQNSTGGSLSGGLIIGYSYNPIRLDDSSKIIIGGGLRLRNQDPNGYSLVSIFGTVGAAGSNNNIVDTSIMFEKFNGMATTGVVEAYGNQANNIGAR